MEHAAELLKVREQLLQSKQLGESERKGRELERQKHREEVERISTERQLKESELLSQIKEKENLLES